MGYQPLSHNPADEKWHSWFAWHPIAMNGKRVWLKSVYRAKHWVRVVTANGNPGNVHKWKYGTIMDVLKG